jgi:hypothetical protein
MIGNLPPIIAGPPPIAPKPRLPDWKRGWGKDPWPVFVADARSDMNTWAARSLDSLRVSRNTG